MLDSAEDFLGRVSFITGPEKHCGKTTFMNRAAELARRGARVAGRSGPALLTVGYDGEARDLLSGARKPSVPVSAGDIIVSTERLARPCSPEILDVVPGSSALGRLCIARAHRSATVALVGPEGNSIVAWAIQRIVSEGYSDTVLVDGAINRITQAAALDGSRFVYALRVDGANIERSIGRLRRMARLVSLPVFDDEACDGSAPYRLHDALSAQSAARLPKDARVVVVDDFTKIFLSDSELASFMSQRRLYVRRRIEFGGFVVMCRGLKDEEFERRLADDEISMMVAYNPYEARVEHAT